MTPTRAGLALLALVALCAPGCRTAGTGGLARQAPALLPSSLPTAAALLRDHNRNAEKVVSIDAKPSISVKENHRSSPGLSGKLAMERPKNFKLELDGPMSKVADIGSNDEEFWFWVKNSRDQAVYFCNYDDQGASPLPSTLQPDLIIEALGLRPIPPGELDRMKVVRGLDPGVLVVSLHQRTAQGAEVLKELVVREPSRRVREYTLWTADRKTVLAHAVVREYNSHTLPAEDGGGSVYLPKRMQLEWAQEKLALDIAMSSVRVNVKFDAERRAALFIEPEGLARVDLAAQAGVAAQPAGVAEGPSTRETMPAPAPSAAPRVKLSEPAPLGTWRSGRVMADASEIAAVDRFEAGLGTVESVVVPALPTVETPQADYIQAHTGWRNTAPPAVER